MIAKTHSVIPSGAEGRLIEVEGDIHNGLPSFNIVGLGSKTVNESRERVRSAIMSSGFSFPTRRVTINLAPAELEKDGSHLDLPIALTILALSGQLRQSNLIGRLFAGELALDGTLRPIRGVINIVEIARAAGFKEIFLPLSNLPQARLITGIRLYGVKNLQELFLHLKGEQPIPHRKIVVKNTKTDTSSVYLDHVIGQNFAKRALSIALTGRHNILIFGPPGTGKTLLAKSAINLLPPLSIEEQITITKLHGISNPTEDIIHERPFRAPHHSASITSILGGGRNANPGEISLAHLGVLFLDELPEFPRHILESLRQPLEDKHITISRANHKYTYPADFMLIATMNPCPCGFAGDPTRKCRCRPHEIINYRNKLSGPLFDRIDMCINVQKVQSSALLSPLPQNNSEHIVVKNKICTATNLQRIRYGKSNFYNASLSSYQIANQLPLSAKCKELLTSAAEKLNLSTRAYFKVIKVARSIADLENTKDIEPEHIAEALSYRVELPPMP